MTVYDVQNSKMKAPLNFVLLFFPFLVFANRNENNGTGTISGKVSTADGQPAANVSVLVRNTEKGSVTDEHGNFVINKIRPGIYILNISLSGYNERAITTEVKENGTTFVQIQLQLTYTQLKKVIVEVKIPKYVATKTSESLRLNLPIIEVPQHITVIQQQLLSDQALVSMTQAMRNVSGVEKTYGELNDYSLIIRGTNATYNIFRNGVGGDWFNQQEDVAMLDKIEVVKGPAGFMGSMSEPGGFVNVVTKQPSKERITHVDVAYGSYNLTRLTTDLGGALTKSRKLCYRFIAGVHKQKRDFQFGKAIRYFICPALMFDFNKKTSVTAEYNYMYGKTSGNNNGLPAVNGKMFVLPRNFAIADAATDAITGIDNYFRLHVKHDFNDNWHLNVQGAAVYGPWIGERLWSDDRLPITNDTIYRVASYEHYINYSSPANAFIDGKFQTGSNIEHKVLFGVDYHNEGSKGSNGGTWDEQKFGLYIPNPDYNVNPDSLKNFKIDWAGHFMTHWIALYVQDHIKIAGKLIITLAGHLTHASNMAKGVAWIPEDEKKITDNAFTPRAGLTWLFGSNLAVYALYDQCFIPQVGRNFEHKRFKPLTGHNFETGMKGYFFNKKLSVDLSIFDIVKNDVLTDDLVHIGYQVQTGQIVSKGVDFDMTGNILPSLIVNVNYEYVDAEVTKESNPTSIGIKNFLTPDHRANTWLQYKLLHGKLKGLSFATGYQFTGQRGAVWYFWNPDKTKLLPAYSLFDAALGYSNEKFNISLNIYNITNTKYAAIGYYNPTGGWKYTPGEPLNFRLSFGINL